MKKLFAVTLEIRLLALGDSEMDEATWFASEVTSVDQLEPDERGSLPWDRRSYDREEGEDVTCEQFLQRQAKPEAGA